MPAAPPKGEGADEHGSVNYRKAKLLFLGRMTEARNGPDKEAWIILLAEVGRYALDRWTVEDKTTGNNTAKSKAVNNLSRRDFDTLAAEAREALNACKERQGEALSSDATEKISNAVVEKIKNSKKLNLPDALVWHGVEVWKGILAFIGLFLFATAVKIIAPAATKATQDGLDIAVGAHRSATTQPDNSISAPMTADKPH